MKIIISLVLILTLLTMSYAFANVNVSERNSEELKIIHTKENLANDQELSEEMTFLGKLKEGYTINDGYIKTSNSEQDSYSIAVNYMMETGKIAIIKKNIYKIPMYGTKEFDFYQECINPDGKYFEALNDEQKIFLNNYNKIENMNSERYVMFDYQGECENNVVELMFDFTIYNELGASEFLAWLSTAEDFASRVKTNGVWDYKSFMGTNTVYGTDTGIYTGEQIGNMHYGTVGSFLFKENTLLAAAGVYQIVSGHAQLSWFSTYFDDLEDQSAISNGIGLHSTYNLPTIADYDN